MKKGFTLAEVLVTLGIVGVVSALTIPALVSNVGTAKVGPALSKAITSFSTANQSMLAGEESEKLSSVGGNYISTLQRYMKLSRAESAQVPQYKNYNQTNIANNRVYIAGNVGSSLLNDIAYVSDDGMYYYIIRSNAYIINNPNAIPSNQIAGAVYVDINGPSKPNVMGKDLFKFIMYNDGSLRAFGSSGFTKGDATFTNNLGAEHTWRGRCDSTTVNGTSETCAGSIFDNGWKVLY